MYSLQSAATPTTLPLVFKVPDDSNLHASRIHMLLQPKSLYISDAVNNFYEIEFEIWAGFGPVGSTEKKIGVDNEQLLRAVFSCFYKQKKY